METKSPSPAPHIRIFPHIKSEFPSLDSLQSWLMTTLKASAGDYRLRGEHRVDDLPPGTLVLFRYGSLLVGEALVIKYAPETCPDTTVTGEPVIYKARVQFAIDTIRVFAPPIDVERLESIVGDGKNLTFPRAYNKIEDWEIYPRFISEHLINGGRLL